MLSKNKFTAAICITLTIACATALAIIIAFQSPASLSILTAVLLAVLVLAQLTLARHHSAQTLRIERYHQLGRKLAHSKRNIKRDEKVALKVLNHIVNQSDNQCEHARIWQLPLADFSGDLAIAYRGESGTTYTLVADLTGHGIAAAMGSTPVASIFQATAKRGLSASQIIIELNDKLTQLLPAGFFCCAAVAVCEDRQITICNAGLPDMLIADNDGNIVDRIESTQLPLGIETLDAADVSLFTKTYKSPHHLYAFTDGLIETRSANDSVFDNTVLESLIANKVDTGSRMPSIQQGFEEFIKGSELCDDISIVEVKIC